MSYPLVGLCGKAGVGKDTIAAMLAEMGGVCIAQADPLKRFGHEILEFTEHQLWGPSEARNAVHEPVGAIEQDTSKGTRWTAFGNYFARLEQRFDFAYRPESAGTSQWLRDVGMGKYESQLFSWYRNHIRNRTDLTPRHALQTLGTEFARRLRPRVWVDYAHEIADALLSNDRLAYNRLTGLDEVKTPVKTKFVVITDIRFRNEVLPIKKIGGIVGNVTGPNIIQLEGSAGVHASETEQDGIPQEWFDAVIYNDKKLGMEKLRGVVEMFAKCYLTRMPSVYTPFQYTVGL